MKICRSLAEYHLAVIAVKRTARELAVRNAGFPATQALLLAVIDAQPGITCDEAVKVSGLDFAQVFADCTHMAQLDEPLVRIETSGSDFPDKAFLTDAGKEKLAAINANG